MSLSATLPPARPSGAPAAPTQVPFSFTQTESLPALLQELGASLMISTYQANKLLVARAAGGGLSMLVRSFDRPMGLALRRGRLALGSRHQVWMLVNAPDIAPRVEPAGQHDACYLPRSSHVTGDIGIHEIAFGHSPEGKSETLEDLWLVSTRFSCLATLSPDYSFVPRWRPPFISAIAAEDRCHLNGLAIVSGEPRFVTALGTTDERDGWRAKKAQGGCIIDVPSGEFVARGLSMPHSPRYHADQLLVLESGIGGLMHVDRASGARESIVQLPGFTRGLAIAEPYAFVGMSKIRQTSAMDGVPLAEKRGQLQCGVAAIDLRRGTVVAMLTFASAVEEIFDVQLLPQQRFPEVIGFQHEAIQHTFVVSAM
jgi:uncharacterized protein (TIGR03032 family)